MLASSDAALLRRLSRADPDRYFATLFAPPARRGGLALLYLFNHELARAWEVASNPVLALIRLQWWREVVEGIEKPHELATPLSAALAAGDLPREDLLALVGARAAEAEDSPADLAAFLAYARGTGGRLARTAGKILGEDSAAIEDLGTAYAIAGILRAAPFLARKGRSLLPADGTPAAVLKEEALALLAARPPRAAFAAWAPAVLARRDLRHSAPRPRGTLDRLAMVRAALTGRV